MTGIHFPRKNGDPRKPDEQILRLQDESNIIEGRDIDEIAAQLRQKYPGDTHERLLRSERDREAEQHKAAARDALAEIVAEAALAELAQAEQVSPKASVRE